ncbi:MAG: hypothetical protein ABH822_02350 [Patescibacteria group bacterium]
MHNKIQIKNKRAKQYNCLRKGQVTLRVLEVLSELVALPTETLTKMMIGPSMGSRLSLSRAIYEIGKSSEFDGREDRKIYFKNLRQINNVLHRLKKESLIPKDGVALLLSHEGKCFFRDVLEDLKGNYFHEYLPLKEKYKKEKGRTTKLIIFDIPERDRIKRDWLRNVLIKLDYKPLQKSVFKGTGKLSAEFILDLQKMRLLNRHVHIFTVKNFGTLNIDKIKKETK